MIHERKNLTNGIISKFKTFAEVKKLYAENYRMLLREIKDINKCKDIPCSWIEYLISLRSQYYPKRSIDSI